MKSYCPPTGKERKALPEIKLGCGCVWRRIWVGLFCFCSCPKKTKMMFYARRLGISIQRGLNSREMKEAMYKASTSADENVRVSSQDQRYGQIDYLRTFHAHKKINMTSNSSTIHSGKKNHHLLPAPAFPLLLLLLLRNMFQQPRHKPQAIPTIRPLKKPLHGSPIRTHMHHNHIVVAILADVRHGAAAHAHGHLARRGVFDRVEDREPEVAEGGQDGLQEGGVLGVGERR